MNNLPQVFEFETNEVRTLIGPDGEPWFVGVDVCAVLCLRRPHNALSALDEDDSRTMGVIDALGREQETIVVNESGVYSLIFRSRRPEAKAFKKWITSSVIPSIRKTGAYIAGTAPATSEVDKLAAVLSRTLPPMTQHVAQLDNRVSVVEASQRALTNAQAINAAMLELHRLKHALVQRTKGTPQPVTYAEFWRKLHEHCGVASFAHRAALTPDIMEIACLYAREWWADRSGGAALEAA